MRHGGPIHGRALAGLTFSSSRPWTSWQALSFLPLFWQALFSWRELSSWLAPFWQPWPPSFSPQPSSPQLAVLVWGLALGQPLSGRAPLPRERAWPGLGRVSPWPF